MALECISHGIHSACVQMDQSFCLHFFSHEIFFFALPSASCTKPNSKLGCFKKKEKKNLCRLTCRQISSASARLPTTPVPGTDLAPGCCQPASAPACLSIHCFFSKQRHSTCQVEALMRTLAKGATKRPCGEGRKAAALLCPPVPQHLKTCCLHGLSQPWLVLLSLQHPMRPQHEPLMGIWFSF